MYPRHSLAWLSAAGWQKVRVALPGHSDAHASIIDRWSRQDWPAIVTRSDPGMPADRVCLGIAAPPSPADGSKTRIAIQCSEADLRRVREPLAPEEARAAVPDHWKAEFSSLMAQAAERRLGVRIYGSLALQSLTGQPYLTAKSDIDLLFYPQSAAQLEEGCALLAAYRKALPLDGEIVFPTGQAVSWKEWLGASDTHSNPRVLVKEQHGVRLSARASLLDAFGEQPCLC